MSTIRYSDEVPSDETGLTREQEKGIQIFVQAFRYEVEADCYQIENKIYDLVTELKRGQYLKIITADSHKVIGLFSSDGLSKVVFDPNTDKL